MVCDLGGTRGRIPYITTIHNREEGNPTQEYNHCTGQGEVEILWPR
jgi:hypothetical protein